MNIFKIENLSNKAGISLKILANEVKMTEEILRRCITENTISANALEKIAELLKVPVNIFFNKNVIAALEDLESFVGDDKSIVKELSEWLRNELYSLDNFIRNIINEENTILLGNVKISNINSNKKPDIIPIKLNIAVEKLHKEGYSYSQIAKELGITKSKAYRVINETVNVKKDRF